MTDETSNASPRKCKDARRDQTTAAVLDLLCGLYPTTFALYEERRWPLKVGIHLDILQRLDGVITPTELSRALRAYVANKVYRSRLKVGVQRRDLDGNPAGVVTVDQVAPKNDAEDRRQGDCLHRHAGIPEASFLGRLARGRSQASSGGWPWVNTQPTR